MKFFNFLLVVALGVVFFSLMGGRFNVPLPAALKELGASLSPGKKTKAVVQVDPNEAKPSVHVRHLNRVRGKVIAVQGNAALVDCDVQAAVSKDALTKLNQSRLEDGDSGRTNFAALVQAEADMQTFGELKMLDEKGNLTLPPHTQGSQARGKILLRGLPVGVGDPVHVMTMALGNDQNGVPVHTARFAVHGGSWMWQGGGRTMLDSKGTGSTLLDQSRPPQAPPVRNLAPAY